MNRRSFLRGLGALITLPLLKPVEKKYATGGILERPFTRLAAPFHDSICGYPGEEAFVPRKLVYSIGSAPGRDFKSIQEWVHGTSSGSTGVIYNDGPTIEDCKAKVSEGAVFMLGNPTRVQKIWVNGKRIL